MIKSMTLVKELTSESEIAAASLVCNNGFGWTPFSDLGFCRLVSPSTKILEFSSPRFPTAYLFLSLDGGGNVITAPFRPYCDLIISSPSISLKRYRQASFLYNTSFAEFCDTNRLALDGFSYSPLVSDIRPFQWHNYHEKNGARFRAEPCFTALLPLKGSTDQTILGKYSQRRRRDLRKSQQSAKVEKIAELLDFSELYADTFARSSSSDGNVSLALSVANYFMQNLGGYTDYFVARNNENTIVAMSLFVRSTVAAYYLFGGANDLGRQCAAQTSIMHRAITHYLNDGIDTFDFVGANSPSRSSFKLDFGSELAPYFSVYTK